MCMIVYIENRDIGLIITFITQHACPDRQIDNIPRDVQSMADIAIHLRAILLAA